MLEVAGLAVGIPPLIVMTFKAFSAVRRVIEEYQDFDETQRMIYNDIKIQEIRFTTSVSSILEGIIDDETRARLLSITTGGERKKHLICTNTEYWSDEKIMAQIETKLGSDLLPRTLENVQIVLRKITECYPPQTEVAVNSTRMSKAQRAHQVVSETLTHPLYVCSVAYAAES